MFFAAVALAGVFLYLPGFLMLAAARVRAAAALCCAPAASVACYAVLTAVLPYAGVAASWRTVFLPCVAAGGLALAFSLRIGSSVALCSLGCAAFGDDSKRARRGNIALLALYIAAGLAVTVVVFVKNLDGPDSFLQAWDNAHHLSSIRAFVESGNYSMLTTTSYAAAADAAFTPFPGESAFYPSAWHCLGALVVDATGIPVVMAANVVNTLVAGVVIPTSTAFLMARLFPRRRGVRLCGAAVSLAFATYPWGFLTFGPLYPNLLSYALLPLAPALFTALFDEGTPARERVRIAALFCLVVVALACSQPNAVFSAGVLLAPFCVREACRAARRFGGSRGRRRALAAGFGVAAAAGIALVWWLFFTAPFMQGVVGFDWPAKEELHQAAANAALLSFGYAPAQLLLSACTAVGLLCVLADRDLRHVGCAFLLACAINVVDASCDGFLKHLLAGFWYTDQLRTASTAVVAAVPLAAFGFFHIARAAAGAIGRCVSHGGAEAGSARFAATGRGMGAAVAALMAVAVFYPSFDIPGHHHVETGFGAIRERVEKQNSVVEMNYLDAAEKEFVAQVKLVVPADEPLINSPDDGSVFLYGYDGLRAYYRSLAGYSLESGESRDSVLIRTGLYRIAEDEEVRAAVERAGAHYVLVLDQGKTDGLDSDEEKRRFLFKDDIDQEIWSGIRAIDDDTPGFEAVLSQGDMRLYRIVA